LSDLRDFYYGLIKYAEQNSYGELYVNLGITFLFYLHFIVFTWDWGTFVFNSLKINEFKKEQWN